MPVSGRLNATAFALSMALHVIVFMLASGLQFSNSSKSKEQPEVEIVFLALIPTPPEEASARVQEPPATISPLSAEPPATAHIADISTLSTSPVKTPASMAAPSTPTSEEWSFASKYTNKNSKGYRYYWGQHVRSLMGAVIEGPDQGFVQFRVEIAPDGSLTKLDTIWTTSVVAEQLARKAIETMPPLPPTPTGKPLIFEKTISFTPFASDGPPIYKDDCLPDPPAFHNPFAWDGKSPQIRVMPPKIEKLDPQAMEECLRQLPNDSIEAETARDKREMERWGWRK